MFNKKRTSARTTVRKKARRRIPPKSFFIFLMVSMSFVNEIMKSEMYKGILDVNLEKPAKKLLQ